ncbi:MAG: hypothetical protein L6R38_003401 [Xanthoria sp. 2 TBL-2021]|nr:MAG: hypothetical protein L6R38_003401 [Xanthoria sp. 2 TBL-2021]
MSRSPDKKRLVSRPLSPDPKRRKSSADEEDVMDKASSRSQSSSLCSESVRAARLAVRETIREGKRPERSDGDEPPEDEPPEEEPPGDEPPEDESSEEESPGRPGPSRVKSGRRSAHHSNDPCSESSSGDSSLQRFLGGIDNAHKALDHMEDERGSLDHIGDEHASLDQETWSLSGRANSRDEVGLSSPNDAGAGPSRRKFSFEAEHELPFTRSSCPSPSPSLPQANKLPGADSKFDQDMHPALDIPKVRGHMPEPNEPTEPSKIESRDVSPWSKDHPDWRHSKKVIAGVITGSMRLERTQPSCSQDSEAEGNRSSASMNVRSSSVSSIATNVAVGCTNEMAEELNEAMDTDISTCDVVALTPPFDGHANRYHDAHGSRYHDVGPIMNSSDANGDDGEEALSKVSSIDPSLQAGVYCRNLPITSATAEPTLPSEEGQSRPDGGSGQPQSTSEALSEASSIDPSFQAGVYGRKLPITSDTAEPTLAPMERLSPASSIDPSLQAGVYGRKLPITSATVEPTLPSEEGQSRSPSLLTSNAGAWTGKKLVVGMSKPAHRNTVDKRRENERDTLTSSSTANLVNADLSGGLVTRSTADDRMEAQRAVSRTQPTPPVVWNQQSFDGGRDQGIGEGRALMDGSPPQSPRQVSSYPSLSEYPDVCLLGACLRLPFCSRRRRSESAPPSVPSEER